MQGAHPPSPLGYPERFEAAAKYIERISGAKLKEETQVLLYALYNQATKGSCNLSKPSGWGAGGAQAVLKWQAWKGLGDMNSMEAQRLYVRTVEEEEPNWFDITQKANGDAPTSLPSVSDNSTTEQGPAKPAVEWATSSSSWVTIPPIAGQRVPLPRYEHAAVMLGHNFCVVGGNYGGRYMSDVWKLNTKTMAWTQIQTRPFEAPSTATASAENGAEKQQVALGPMAGHTATAWNDTLVLIGGHSKAVGNTIPAISVQVMDLIGEVASLTLQGPAPPSRGSHTASLAGRRIYIFGGEDPRHCPLGDLWFLDLDAMTWGQPEVTGKAPTPRSAHTATVYLNRYLLIFGGGSVATCHNDVYVLDTHAIPMEWSQPKVSGVKLTPRAGHTGVLVGSVWYIVGGGNNKTGCPDMLALDLSQIQQGAVSCSSAAAIPNRHPLSSEGVALAVVGPASGAANPHEHVLISFGGYNGKYQNSVNVIRISDQPQPAANGSASASMASSKAEPASVAQAAPAAARAPPPPPAPTDAELLAEARAKLEAAERDAEAALKEVAAAKETAGHELALLRKQLDAAQTAAAASQKELEVAKVSLSREREKVMKLEAEVAELRKKLEAAADVQKDLEALRKAVKESEAKKGGGVWGYISGQS